MTKHTKAGGHDSRPVRGHAAVRGKRSGLPTVAWLALGGVALVLVGLLLTRQALSSSGAAAPAAVRVTGKAKLAVDRDSIDFGRLPLDKPVEATFKLTNDGDKPLTVAGTPQVEAVKGC